MRPRVGGRTNCVELCRPPGIGLLNRRSLFSHVGKILSRSRSQNIVPADTTGVLRLPIDPPLDFLSAFPGTSPHNRSHNVFNGRMIERFLDKVGESFGVVGVSIDGCGGEVSDSHIFGEPNGEVAGTFIVGTHLGFHHERALPVHEA